MATVTAKTPVTITFVEGTVEDGSNFYKTVTPKVKIGKPRFNKDQVNLAITKEMVKLKLKEQKIKVDINL